jgi:transcription-repair coupling factor (superfamily II helicase)
MEFFPEISLLIDKLQRERIDINGLTESAKGAFLVHLCKKLDSGILFITPFHSDLESIKKNVEFFLNFFNGKRSVLLFPEPFHDPFTPDSIYRENIIKRIEFYKAFIELEKPLVLTSPKALLKPMISKKYVKDLFLILRVEGELEKEELQKKLVLFGYKNVDYVSFKGEMAIRGGIIDFFSPKEENPVRVEIIDDRIGSLRYFDPSTQRSIRQIEEAEVISLIEYPSSPEFIEYWHDKKQDRFKDYFDYHEAEESLENLNFLPPLSNEYFDTFDEFFKDFVIVLNERKKIKDEIEKIEDEWKEIYERELKKGKNPPPLYIFSFDKLKNFLEKGINLSEFEGSRSSIFIDARKNVSYISRAFQFFEDLKDILGKRGTVFIVLRSDYLIKRISEELEEQKIPFFLISDFSQMRKKSLNILKGDLQEGFYLPQQNLYLYTEKEIIGERGKIEKRRLYQPFTSTFRDLKDGDYIVHDTHGIGIFRGLKKLEVQNQILELLEIEYRDGDRLYITPERMNEIHKYSGGGKPDLDKLGGVTWEKTKKRIKKALREMAMELLNLYALRKSVKGYAFSPDTEWQKEFEEAFPFEETEDQRRVTEEVKRDMESESPMDRLLCGDVGYGKTEVAMRASFKAVMDGKQVAVLCPTTILAIQHLNTFRKRFSGYPVRIEGLTRLTPKKEAKRIIDDLKRGLIDIIIGTHRLLSSDIGFRDLGLLIIDEEQRFGVAQKEKLKKLKTSVDVLTMTATPIPRTLYMSLSGIRDLSIIKTPPKDRLAVQCFVVQFSKDLIRDAIRRELERGGQVYFVHNRIENIYKLADFVKKIVPEARVDVIHGRMKGEEMEKKMIKFINKEFDVLVTTTIIENGIDIPLVNTLIVNRADTFGLAQLYQLKGRVGRSNRQAFAYFLIPPEKSLSEDAIKRLKALREFADLGSSFRLAAMDLEIRGAGNLLGPQQHGHIQAVGFDYYIKLLEETVRELKGEYVEEKPIEIQLGFDIVIPEDYISDFSERLSFYKRISSINDLKEIEIIESDARDRFGSPPKQFQNILQYGKIKFLAKQKSIIFIKREDSSLTITFGENPPVNPENIVSLFKRYKGNLKGNSIFVSLEGRDEKSILQEIVDLLNAI